MLRVTDAMNVTWLFFDIPLVGSFGFRLLRSILSSSSSSSKSNVLTMSIETPLLALPVSVASPWSRILWFLRYLSIEGNHIDRIPVLKFGILLTQ
jgi:hypothetical protein